MTRSCKAYSDVRRLRCTACGTVEAFTTGDVDWCPNCHAQGKRVDLNSEKQEGK